jgi:hypothetical protein
MTQDIAPHISEQRMILIWPAHHGIPAAEADEARRDEAQTSDFEGIDGKSHAEQLVRIASVLSSRSPAFADFYGVTSTAR